MDTQYKIIQGYNGAYMVGSDGTVWSRKNGRWGFRKNWKRLFGHKRKPHSNYPYVRFGVCLTDPKTNRKNFKFIHHVVLETFVGPCPHGYECAHLNGDATDNRVENLQWTTHKENSLHTVDHGSQLKGENHHAAKLTEQQVREIKLLIKNKTKSLRAIAREYNVSYQAIHKISQNKSYRNIQPP
jgi:hypothetical protein